MKRGYWLFTVLRNGKYITLVDSMTNPIIFLAIEKELMNETFLINQFELTENEYKFYKNIN